jgi:hypothetical protein
MTENIDEIKAERQGSPKRSGYVKHDRDRFRHHLFENEKWCRGYAWDWMVAQASWQGREFDIKGKTVALRRGQFTASVRFMAEKFNWSKDQVARFLTRLKTETMIETSTATGQLVVTICNYDKYQAREDFPATATETPPATEARQDRDKTEEGKERKEINNNTPLTPQGAWDGLNPYADEMNSGVVQSNDGSIRLVNGTYAFWLREFGNDADRLSLALIEAAAARQRNSRQPIKPQIERVLARIAGEKRDRDNRYQQAAAKPKQSRVERRSASFRGAINALGVDA